MQTRKNVGCIHCMQSSSAVRTRSVCGVLCAGLRLRDPGSGRGHKKSNRWPPRGGTPTPMSKVVHQRIVGGGVEWGVNVVRNSRMGGDG